MAPLRRSWAAALLLAACIASASGGLSVAAPAEVEPLSSCVDRIASKLDAAQGARQNLWDAANFCQTLVISQRLSDEQQIRADNFTFQRSENVVLMWMVVSITIAGVVLAGIQLWASYSLAKLAHSNMEGMGSDVGLSKDKLAVQSSVIGVVVLTISFAFFLVFVLYVYTFQNPDQANAKQTQAAGAAPTQVSAGPLTPSSSTSQPAK